jgi:hypothetical protein
MLHPINKFNPACPKQGLCPSSYVVFFLYVQSFEVIVLFVDIGRNVTMHELLLTFAYSVGYTYDQ